MDVYNDTLQFCRSCGAQLGADSLFCPSCGKKQGPENPVQPDANPGINKPAAWAGMNPPYSPSFSPKPKKKGRAAIVVLSILTAVFAFASIALTVLAVNLNADLSYYSDQYREERSENQAIQDEYEFYHEYAVVFNEEENDYYHRYGCPYFNDSSFNIYNSKLAESKGIKPCPYCIDS